VLFLMILFAPGSFSLFSKKHFLTVPGGLVVRKAIGGSGAWQVHLFERRRSILCIYCASVRQWNLAVADAQTMETTSGTKLEMDFALRAWLSPLSPPLLEHLSDLT
jgi:hypothetical protein